MEPLPNAMKALRENLDLSQAAMARLLGLSLAGYANYEHGDRVPTPDTLEELSRLAEDYRFPKLGSAFDEALEEQLKGRTGPATEQERAWCEAYIQLLRRNVISAQMQKEIVETLEGGREIEPDLKPTFIRLKVAMASNAEEKVKILAEAHAEESGASPAQAYAYVLNERPELAARMELERTRTKRPTIRGKGTK